MAQPIGDFLPGVKYNGLNVPTVSGKGATYTLLPNQSGSLVLFDAASQVYTLPAPSVGMYFDFVSTITSATNQEVDTDAATTFIGGVVNIALEATTPGANPGPKFFSATATSSVKIAMSGSTTGGVIGSNFRLTCVSSTLWYIRGTLLATGTIATPFA
jgi:phage baseplate assembly protein gpV